MGTGTDAPTSVWRGLTQVPVVLFVLLTACAGRAAPDTGILATCPDGSLRLTIQNDRPMRVRVLEQGQLDATRVLGELSGRGTESFDIIARAGTYYSVMVVETGELIGAENSHPRGYVSKGATISRACTA